MSIRLPHEIDSSKIQYSPVIVNDKGGKSCKVRDSNGEEVYAQFGRLIAPFEISQYESAENPDRKSYLTVNFDGYQAEEGETPRVPGLKLPLISSITWKASCTTCFQK